MMIPRHLEYGMVKDLYGLSLSFPLVYPVCPSFGNNSFVQIDKA
jgi:hypothetical protein